MTRLSREAQEMLTVDDYEVIRRKHLVDGETQRAIVRELSHSRNTVAKAFKHPIPPGYRLSQPRARPMIEPVRSIIDAWLAEDRKAPGKQRHTRRRIWERLRDEYHFKGSYASVRRYVEVARWLSFRCPVWPPFPCTFPFD